MLDPTERFSTRVENYIKYRPHYPAEVLDILREKCGLTPEWRIADIGSGTGILTELFLQNGNPTFGVEPNGPMREAAERLLAGYSIFTSVDGTAENTTLGDTCVGMVTAGQAFHWFDPDAAGREFRRILKPGGWVMLIWNNRRPDASPFMAAYSGLIEEYTGERSSDYGMRIDVTALSRLFALGGYEEYRLGNRRVTDYEVLKGGLLSASYTPEAGHPRHEPMITELRRIFDEYQSGGQVVFEYDTQVYLGQLNT